MKPAARLLIVAIAMIAAAGQHRAAVARPGGDTQPKSPIAWFRRADGLTNIRMPESAPFHMTVTFHAYPGLDFARRGKSPIMTGDGTYEETWLAPGRWRREVVFGTYRAIEVRADGVRKFQATSDYEPSRVFLLMRALLVPIPRQVLEPQLQDEAPHWKLEHLAAGQLPYVRISVRHAVGRSDPDEVTAYEFLPNGILVRAEEPVTALLTSWQDFADFAGKLVPRHISVRGAGLDGDMVTAEVAISNLPDLDPAILRIPGNAAEPGQTLQPVDSPDEPLQTSYFETPGSSMTSVPYPAVVKTSVMAIVDRQGTTREAEISGIRVFGQQPSRDDMEAVKAMAESMVEAIRKDRFRPAMADGQPCESIFAFVTYGARVHWW